MPVKVLGYKKKKRGIKESGMRRKLVDIEYGDIYIHAYTHVHGNRRTHVFVLLNLG